MNRALFSLVCGSALFINGGFADELPVWETPNELLRITPNGPDVYLVSFYGRVGRAYYLQYSEDFITWTYYPGIATLGLDTEATYPLFISGPERFFVRLVSPLFPVTDPYNDDPDGDRVKTGIELEVGTDPFQFVNTDRDGDGMSND